MQLIRTFATWLRARLLLASPAPARSQTDRAWKLAAKLRREGIGFADVQSALIRAAVALQDERMGPAQAIEHLRYAIAAAADNDMAFHCVAAQCRLGALVGGLEGETLITRSDKWMRDQGVVNPLRMINIVAPGFDA